MRGGREVLKEGSHVTTRTFHRSYERRIRKPQANQLAGRRRRGEGEGKRGENGRKLKRKLVSTFFFQKTDGKVGICRTLYSSFNLHPPSLQTTIYFFLLSLPSLPIPFPRPREISSGKLQTPSDLISIAILPYSPLISLLYLFPSHLPFYKLISFS